MFLRRPVAMALLVTLALVVAACSAAATSPRAGSGQPAGTRIAVTLSDAMKIEPATITVPLGTPVTFVVTNKGAIDHEFFVGNEQAHAAHEKTMSGHIAMEIDEPTGIHVKLGQTKELTLTFTDTTPVVGGCHVPGHYLAGMKVAIVVQ